MVYYLIQQVMIHLPPLKFHCVSNDAMHKSHKVLIYVEYSAVSDVFQNTDNPTPLLLACPPPAPKAGGGYTLAGR
jgi:hypothetical protein